MDHWLILITAISLGLDAFSVSVAAGAYSGKTSGRQKFRLSFHFGLFQYLMPVLGWLLGSVISDSLKHWDHWIAFAILAAIGSKMIWDGIKNVEEEIKKDISKGMTLVGLSIATSIDALAVGFGIGLIGGEIIIAGAIIGIVASAMSLIGIAVGEALSGKLGNKAMIIGGIALILIGLNIVAEHTKIFA